MKPRTTTNQNVGTSPSTQREHSGSASRGSGPSDSPRQEMQQSSPQELHDKAKLAVSKGLAAAAGVLEGFAERMRDDHIADKASDSIHQAGDVTIKVTQATREEANRIQSEIRTARVEVGGDSSQSTMHDGPDSEGSERSSTLPSGPSAEGSERSGMLRRSSRR